MQDLRLIGVHEDGVHLLLADDEGNRFRIPLDDSLRAAVRRDRPRLGQLQLEIEGGLRPKDVQGMIRAGLTAEEVAERAGWTVEKVHRYEVPILAERVHVAGLARQVRLRGRAAPGGASTLGARVAERLRSRELDPDATRWDSRRTERGVWTVVVLFNAGGRQREAAWDFDPLSRTVIARDDEARWLSEDEDTQGPGPIPAPHLAALAGSRHVYDVEAEGGISPRPRGTSPRSAEPVDLMEAIRERSAQRVRHRKGRGADVPGIDAAPEDALPIEDLARPPSADDLPPPAHGHPADDPRAVRATAVQESQSGSQSESQSGSQPDVEPAAGAVSRPANRRRRRTAERHPGDSGPEAAEGDARTGRSPSPERRKPSAADRAAETQPLPQSDRPVRAPKPSPDEDTHAGAPARRTAEEEPGRTRQRSLHEVPEVRAVHEVNDDLEPADRHPDEHPDDPPADEVTESQHQRTAVASQPRRPSTRKSGRPSVPSWDDIMFGRKGD
ncbi:septation protein SepH [Intrasporangium calvum]|uniref:septation protein SepH n=1 Tax=Intrasporangium calvum TaxID=53358 RepID=UPI000DF61D82|nr:septation protein SepH [Intrasporangium calvum]AXG13479.1 DUF3071 domain-containing protein [Intrasporangium calvum]